MGFVTSRVATTTRNQAAQRVIASDSDTLEILCTNHYLTDQIFTELYKNKKIPAGRAKALITASQLSPAKFAHLLSVETRGTVINALFENGEPTQAELHALVRSKALSRVVVDKVVADYNDIVDVEWLQLAADKVGGRALIELWLRTPDAFADVDIVDKLTEYKAWGPATPDRARLTWLLAMRPGVIAGAARSDSLRLRTIAAGCRHLTSRELQLATADLDTLTDDTQAPVGWAQERVYTLMALANNPVTFNDVTKRCDIHLRNASDPDHQHSAESRMTRHPVPVSVPYQEESSPTQLTWLLRRTLPSQYGEGSRGRLYDAPALLANVHLSAPDAFFICGKLLPEQYPYSEPRLLGPVNDLFDRFPELADRYERPPRELDKPDQQPQHRWADHPTECTSQELDTASLQGSASLSYGAAGLQFLERELGQDEQAWAFALRAADNQFPGTLADLAMVTLAAVA